MKKVEAFFHLIQSFFFFFFGRRADVFSSFLDYSFMGVGSRSVFDIISFLKCTFLAIC